MGIGHVLLLLMYLDPLGVLSAATPAKKPKPSTRKPPRTTLVPTTLQPRTTPPAPVSTHDTCLGYYDVSGQYDKMFECNNTDHRYCCGTCFLRFCCEYKKDRLNQKACDNYQSPKWVQTAAPSPVPTGDTYDPSMDPTNTAVYITCGIIAFIIVLGVSVKVAYDKATEPPQEMNIHRALADILRQQGPIPISQYDCENFAAMNGSPKDNTPVRTSSKNHYTPVHSKKKTPEKPRLDGILTSQTEPFDLSFSRSFQSLSHLPPSYEAAMAADLSRFSSLKKLSDKDVDEYYTRKRHLPDLAARGTLPLHVLKMSQELVRTQQRPRRVQRAMSQDRVLTPQTAPQQDYSMSPNGMSPYGGRILSDEQLLSAERLRSQERLISGGGFRGSDKSISRAISHTDVFMPTTPIMDRYKMAKMHSHPSASNNGSGGGGLGGGSGGTGHSNTLAMNQTASKRQAFASRRTHTVEQLHYVPQQQHHQQQQAQSQHYRTGSKTEVTV
ncbi:protein shisa-6 isoform X5 [Periophthalmus magnuspinnatus]|uniref:protein shisa-6 isoform X5 n=1 Tax=Periophthalmus magnuspinnatus TaxID=409849 RepID=UPI0024371870|nr:protein shisa-6 isoform X5 [Periophthalmus magnuspinnatus]